MSFLKAIKTHHLKTTKPSAVKARIGEIEDENQLTHGAIHFFDDRVVIFAAAEGAPLYSPALLQHFSEDALVIIVKGESIFIFARFDGDFKAEFEFKIDDSDDSSDVNRLRSFCAVYQQKIESVPWYCNTETRSTGTKSVAIAEILELPLDPHNLKPFEEIKPIKPILANELVNEVRKGTKRRNLISSLLIISVFTITGLGWQYGLFENEKVETTKITKPKLDPYFGLNMFWTKNSADPKHILRDIYRVTNKASLLRGWDLSEVKVVLDQKNVISQYYVLDSIYGRPSELAKFAQENGFDMNVNGTTAYLARKISKKPVYSDYARFHVGTWHNWLSSGLEDLWDNVDYAINLQENASKRWILSQGEITFPSLHTNDLESLGSLMYGSPYSFSYLEMKVINRHEKIWEAMLKIQIAGVESNA